MTAEHAIHPDVQSLADLLGDRIAGAQSLALLELREALAPAKKTRSEAAERIVFRTIALDDGTATTTRPNQIVGRGITENRARVTIWCGTGMIVYLADSLGAVQNADSRTQLIPLTPIVLNNANELYVWSPDVAATVSLIVEDYDAP